MAAYSPDTAAEEVALDCHSQIANKTILVTGVTPGGLGAAFAAVIAKHEPACIILATRDIEKAKLTARDIAAVAPDVRTRCVRLDLASLRQIRESAAAINLLDEHIDIIINNAGIMAVPFAKTADGIESQFATNHIGHFLLTNLLLEKMLARDVPVRVVNVSSSGFCYGPVRFEDWNFDVSRPFLYLQSSNTNSGLFSLNRMATATIGGSHMRNPSLPTCCSPCRWPRSWATVTWSP
jgi:NAD(P)-dependent dehydrogenase (short-subunit alcohol dehydrogenase family)